MNEHYFAVCLPKTENIRVQGYNTKLGRKVKTTNAISIDDAVSNVIAREFPKKVGIIDAYIKDHFGNLSEYTMDFDTSRAELLEMNEGQLEDTCEFYGLTQTMSNKFSIKSGVCEEHIQKYIEYRDKHPLTK